MGVKVKICCIKDAAEAGLAYRYGAAAIGLVSAMPSGPGVITESEIARILATAPPIATFLLTSYRDAAAIIAQQRRCPVTTLQLCDTLPADDYDRLHDALPDVKIVQVIHVTGRSAIDHAGRLAPLVDGLLLDSGNPDLAVKELGGTGRTHNWDLSREICSTVAIPVYLAGGLNPTNVAMAIRSVRPWGVDVCTGIRTADCLDESKLAAFMQAVAEAG
ncbi:MAG: phosphoribosylanthranilate isomerase [Candidatus Neomarinimicrobiota bacterium]